MRTGRREIWDATSEDGVWGYQREEDAGTLWYIRHRPTGVAVPGRAYGSLIQARRWTARPDALTILRQHALAQISEWPDAEVQRRYGRVLRLLDGTITQARVPAEALCVCGAYLGCVEGTLTHLDICDWCEGEDQPCTIDDAWAKHPGGCDQPKAAQCEHNQCRKPNAMYGRGCEADYHLCCGDGHGEG